MASYVWIALPGRWGARLLALLSAFSRQGGVARSRCGQEQQHAAPSTTM